MILYILALLHADCKPSGATRMCSFVESMKLLTLLQEESWDPGENAMSGF
jgi:hypothetical protein